jgi:hypothetical protein
MKQTTISLAVGCAALVLGMGAQAAGVDVDSGGVPTIQSQPAPDGAAGDFGVVQSYFTAVGASSLVPYQTGFNYIRNPSGTGIYCSASSTDSRATADFQLPHGASLSFLRVWAVDTDVQDMTMALDELCQPDFAAAQPIITLKGTVTTSGAPGQFTGLDSLSGTVDNQSCVYRLRVQFGPSTTSCSGSSVLAFYKARVQWNRQIKPAPATASFTDVPVGSQFHGEVEALAASGITAGCTATQFCPTATVTRLQMAAFLARALGLQWDTIVDPANP